MFLCFNFVATCSAFWVCVRSASLVWHWILHCILSSLVILSIVLFLLFSIYWSLLVGIFDIFLSSISVFIVLIIFTFRYSCFHFLLIFFVSISPMLTLYFLFILSMCCPHLLLFFHVCFIYIYFDPFCLFSCYYSIVLFFC